ncbi:MAG: sarcosine oxidase subunit gamma SoxG [Deltaproteobacteria bacterium]|nr:sarcosine oxidase subunit gamma SoxG [Deltaproteobacteria bacterium]
MENIIRRSPVSFDSKPLKTDVRDNWTVVTEYEDEGSGPFVIDLSHRARWDLQESVLANVQPWGIHIPDSPGQCVYENGIIINRMNRTQASIWHLSGEMPTAPEGPAFTDVTDATVFLALYGNNIFSIAEKLTSLDFLDPSKKAPFLLQGPFSHVPCQIVTLERSPENCGILLTCSRGYARDMTAAILEAGEEFELHPAGENAFVSWLSELSG